MKYFLTICVLLTGCTTYQPELALVQTSSVKKQKQRLAVLQKKLEIAEKDKQKAEAEVAELTSEVDEARLALVRKQIKRYQEKNSKKLNALLEEQETLCRIIQKGSSFMAFEAQLELDKIVRLITTCSDES